MHVPCSSYRSGNCLLQFVSTQCGDKDVIGLEQKQQQKITCTATKAIVLHRYNPSVSFLKNEIYTVYVKTKNKDQSIFQSIYLSKHAHLN